MFEVLELPFMQRAILEVVLLAPIAGLIGAQIVLRGLAFHTHGVGAATFPGLVVAGSTAIPAAPAALAAGLVYSGLAFGLRSARVGRDGVTALLVVAFLAAGVILASDVFESGAAIDQLLFGSLLAIGPRELASAVVVLALALAASAVMRRRWVRTSFDGEPAAGRSDLVLVLTLAIAIVVTIDAVGALLVSSILVLPAATARLHATSVGELEVYGGLIALLEGLLGLLVAYTLDAPPGATIATLGGVVFALAALAERGSRRVVTGGAR